MRVDRTETRTGGRPETTGNIAGDCALSVGMPDKPAPNGWRWTKVTDVARLETGHTPSRKHPEYWGGTVPWIGIKDATENHGRMIYSTIQYTNEIGIANSSARVLPENTVCLSRTASVGYVLVMGRPMATSQDFVNWVCKSGLDATFLKYVLLAEKSAFLRFASGTTHQTIYFPEVKAFHICLPPISEQRAIAHVLGTLDDRIEASRRMAAGLEEMARALFQSWFVRFDPVRAKMEGRWRKGESLPGLPAALHDLFPAHVMETEHGQIPEGWSSCQLAEITTALSGGTPSKADGTLWDGGIPWLSPKSMTSLHATETPETVTPAAIGRGTRLAPMGAIFVMVRGMGLHQGLRVSQARREMAFNQDVKALIPEAVSSEFLLFGILSQSKSLHSKVKAAGHGTGVLETDILLGTRICCPPRNIARELSAPLKSANEKLAVCEAQNNTLASIRDALLPKLVSGAIRVKDAEAFLKERGL